MVVPDQSLLDSGALVVFGSDWFVSSGNPLLGIETAITRRDPLTTSERPFDHQRIGLSAPRRPTRSTRPT